MAQQYPPVKASAYTFYVGLPSADGSGTFQANPTLATGDAQISKDGGAFANLATLPTVTPASGKSVQVSLSGTEMDADNIVVLLSDAAGAQWNDVIINIQTEAGQLTFNSGRADVSVGAMQANVMTAAAAAADLTTELQSGLATASALATVDSVVDAILVDTAEIGTAGAGLTALASAANLATVDGVVDAIKLVTDNLPDSGALTSIAQASALATAQADLDILTGTDGAVIASGTQTFNMTGDITGNLSGSVGSVTGNVGGNVTGSVGSLATQAKEDVNAEADQAIADGLGSIADAVHDEVVEGSYTLRQYARLWASVLLGKVSGGGTGTEVFRDTADSKDRVTSVNDASGNRTSVTLDGS